MDRPFRYRDATKKLRKRRVVLLGQVFNLMHCSWDGTIPFEPINIESLSDSSERLKLLQSCNIDMSVHPVWDQRGGERIALARWEDFRSKRLSGYARRRNNALIQRVFPDCRWRFTMV